MSTDRLLTVQQVADRLGTGISYPRYLIHKRLIRFVRIGRNKVRIPESAIAEMIQSGTVEPRPSAGRAA